MVTTEAFYNYSQQYMAQVTVLQLQNSNRAAEDAGQGFGCAVRKDPPAEHRGVRCTWNLTSSSSVVVVYGDNACPVGNGHT